MGFPGVSVVKNPPAMQETRVWSMVRKIPWRRKWQPTLAFLPGKSHGQRSLAGYSPQGHKRVGHDLVIKQQHNNKIFALKCCASFCCRARWISYQSVSQFSHVQIFATPWIAACQASLSITNSQSSLKLTSIRLVMPSSHLILCRPLLLLSPIPPSIRVFSNESTLRMRCQSTGVSAWASFFPKNTQGWSPLEWTG